MSDSEPRHHEARHDEQAVPEPPRRRQRPEEDEQAPDVEGHLAGHERHNLEGHLRLHSDD